MAFGSILSNVKGIMSGNIFGLGSDEKLYPTANDQFDVKAITNFKNEYNQEWRKSMGYAFQVYDVDKDGFTFESDGWKEFRLQINPQELSQDEIFAIEVTPTLRGVLVEHHGQVLKDITISGTTGISPNRKEGGASNDGRPVLQEGHSGYEEFHELRSYFRVYVEAKRLAKRGAGSDELRMVFKNFKDDEYLYVEPIKFSMKRSARRPHLYDYTIQMKGIGVANQNAFKVDNSFLAKLEEIDEKLDKALEYLDEGQRLIKAGFAIVNRLQRDINAVILAPTLAIQQAIAAFRGGKAMTLTQLGVTRKAIDDLRNSCTTARANVCDALGVNTSDYNKFVGRSSTLVAGNIRTLTYQESGIVNGFNKIEKGLLLVAGLQDKVFEKNVAEVNSEVINNYTSGNLDIKTPSSTKQVDIGEDDNIQTIATKHLGDPDKFKDIVLLNNLKPPYVSASGGNGVLKPGDTILIPQYTANGKTGIAKNKEYNITSDLQESEKNLGVDIRLDDNGDLAIANTKDLDLIAGMDNMSQATTLKFAYQKGSLKRHPQIGTSLEIGRKSNLQMSQLKDEIVGSFSADSRISSIPFITLKQEGNTIYINMLIKLKGASQPVPLPLVIQN